MTLFPLGETDSTELVLNVICCFSRIDFDLVSPHITSILQIVAKVNLGIHAYNSSHLMVISQLSSSSKPATEFLALALDYHKKTRALPTYFSMILDASERTMDITDPGDPRDAYTAILGGPIFENSHVEKLRKALQGFVTPGQCLGFLAQTKSALERACPEHLGQQDILDAESSKRSRKRRKLNPESTTCSFVGAVKFTFVCSLISVAWSSLPVLSLADKSRSEAVRRIQGVNTSVIMPLLSAGLKRERGGEGGSTSQLWSRDIITSSALRLQYTLSIYPQLGFLPMHDTKTESRMLRLLESSDVLPELKIEIVNPTFFLWKRLLTNLLSRAGHFS